MSWDFNFPDPPLTDGHVLLRLPRDGDVEFVLDACSDPEMHVWIPNMPYPYSRNDAERFVSGIPGAWRACDNATFVIADADDLQPIGTITLHVSARDLTAAGVGYWVHRARRGRRAASRAVALVAAWAFDQLGVERLDLVTAPDNAASRRVAERNGFSYEGLLRAWLPTPRGRRDCRMYSLLAGDPRPSLDDVVRPGERG